MPRYKNVNGEVIELTPEEEADLDARAEASDLNFSDLRVRRDSTLAGCDWTLGVDSPLSDEKKAEWTTYRQELRDYPAQSDRLSTMPDWPTPPE